MVSKPNSELFVFCQFIYSSDALVLFEPSPKVSSLLFYNLFSDETGNSKNAIVIHLAWVFLWKNAPSSGGPEINITQYITNAILVFFFFFVRDFYNLPSGYKKKKLLEKQ